MSSKPRLSTSKSTRPRNLKCKPLDQRFFDEEKKLPAIVKHNILKRYLGTWSAILCQNKWAYKQYKHIVYVDGFAGPGIHHEGETYGSPTLAYELLLEHKNILRVWGKRTPKIHLIFIEKNPESCATLFEELRKLKDANIAVPNAPFIKYMIINGEFASAMKWVISDEFEFPKDSYREIHYTPEKYCNIFHEHVTINRPQFQRFITPTTPLLVFADPFGFSGSLMPMTLMKSILQITSKSELFINFMTGFIVRFLTLDSRSKAINTLLGSEDWKFSTDILDANDAMKKRERLLSFYYQQLRELLKTFTTRFEIRDDRNRVLYHLLFVTQHPAAFDGMKRSMGKWTRNEYCFDFSVFNDIKGDIEKREIDTVKLALDAKAYFVQKYPNLQIPGQAISNWIDADPYLYQKFRNQLKKELEKYCVSERGMNRFDEMVFDFGKMVDIDEETDSSASSYHDDDDDFHRHRRRVTKQGTAGSSKPKIKGKAAMKNRRGSGSCTQNQSKQKRVSDFYKVRKGRIEKTASAKQ